MRESRVLEEDDDDSRRRRALRVSVRRVQDDEQAVPQAVQQQQAEGRADATPAPAAGGSFLETVQNQLPGQLQGLGGAMEKSEMVVGTFQVCSL